MANADGPTLAAPGTVLAGKLRVERVIGQGAMGVVYECTDTTLNRRVAVKLMSAEVSNDEELRRRFAREARAASSITSEHAVRVLEVGEALHGGGNAPFIAMELLQGQSLEKIVDTSGPVPFSSAVDWILQALDAIGEAHANGLVHRDVKPGNLFLTDRPGREPIVKVLDFGLVKVTDPSATKLTKTGSTPGSPGYMSPEQVRGARELDARADVWSIGATIHELLTGKLPFAAPTVADMLARIVRDAPDPIREGRPDIPEKIEAVVKRCLEKDPNDRYESADHLAEALEAATAGPSFTIRLDRKRRRTGTALMAPLAAAPPAAEAELPYAPTLAGPPLAPSSPPPANANSPPSTARRGRRSRRRHWSRTKIFVLSAACAIGIGGGLLTILVLQSSSTTTALPDAPRGVDAAAASDAPARRP